MEWVLGTEWSVCDTWVNNVCLPQAGSPPLSSLVREIIKCPQLSQPAAKMGIFCTLKTHILPLCFTPIMKIFLILIQDQGLSSIFVIVNFLAVIALREDVVLSGFHSLYFLWDSWQKLLLGVGQIRVTLTRAESWETICLLVILLEHWLTKWSLILATAGTRFIEQ